MKNLFILLFTLLSFNSFAGEFSKSESGSVQWIITEKGMDGEYRRQEIEFEFSDLRIGQAYRLTEALALYDQTGDSGKFLHRSMNPINEQGADIIRNHLKTAMADQLKHFPLNYSIKSNDLSLNSLECREKGMFSNRLVCTAQYENILIVELID
jgi:hypothetical protein